MTEIDANNLKSGSRVKMKYLNSWATGEVTIVRKIDCKIIFDGDFDLDYDYYPIKDLEFIEGENDYGQD